MNTHATGLAAGYGAAAIGFLLVSWAQRRRGHAWWPCDLGLPPARPRRAVAMALVAAVLVPLIGATLYPTLRTFERGPWRAAAQVANQLLIFAPILVLLWRDPRGLRGALLAPRGALPRLAIGLALSILAVFAYALVRPSDAGALGVLAQVWQPQRLPHLAQVALEDLAVGLLLLRVADAFGARVAVTAVALLFALGHIPAMLGGAAPLGAYLALSRDVALGVAMGTLLLRSRDIAWFLPLHFSMDMTQFL